MHLKLETNLSSCSYPHYMLKEILEEPSVVGETIEKELEKVRKVAQAIKIEGFEMMYITGSGTSYHAGLASQYALSNLTNILTSIVPASEFHRWIPRKISRKVLLMAISQSGESSDILEAVKAALEREITILAITNTFGSRLARLSDYHLLARSGKEKAIPATKTYVTQLITIFMLSLELASGIINSVDHARLKNSLFRTPHLLDEVFKSINSGIRDIAEKYAEKGFFFLLGSGPNYATALEGALKLKETCNVYAEGFATREFLHGPVRLLDERTPVIIIVSPDEVEVSLSLIRSLRNFGAPVITISEFSDESAKLSGVSDEVVLLPSSLPKVFSPILYVTPLQLFAYYSSVSRGLNPDGSEKLRKVVK